MFVTIRLFIAIIFISYFVLFLFQVFLCKPREKIWNKLMTTGYCYNGYTVDEVNGIFNVVSDFAILMIPMHSLWRLHMSLKKKLLTMSVFAIGFW